MVSVTRSTGYNAVRCRFHLFKLAGGQPSRVQSDDNRFGLCDQSQAKRLEVDRCPLETIKNLTPYFRHLVTTVRIQPFQPMAAANFKRRFDTQSTDFECFAKTGVNTSETTFPNSGSHDV